ncbi:MAG: Rrf2 family transcriptional regulator [Rhodospirillales bacterium]|nr:Rrf2 family transcriptional regulator [Rhodospirillales bacterium]MCW8861876.1 Rrf2 family transcriptional regulator [Rhodospirillales bacterium]MCW8951943.1 Rrf2 family transcriptional regulator [Rhodospirillales bacterium]MCW9001243.1 Rrf2 family transcriptional regulator [Rhodospirillales bacterium]MCW9039652.1 Rrf2 family transcriptional regulator [Rhodospirillales bacterium]
MKLQKATQYALFAVLELARDSARQLSATDIAALYGISANHLAKVLRDLGRAGLVESVRGAGGGYRFCGNAKRTTLHDVIALFEEIGPGAPDSKEPGDDTEIGHALLHVMTEIDEIARATLMAVSLETLIRSIAWHAVREDAQGADKAQSGGGTAKVNALLS